MPDEAPVISTFQGEGRAAGFISGPGVLKTILRPRPLRAKLMTWRKPAPDSGAMKGA